MRARRCALRSSALAVARRARAAGAPARAGARDRGRRRAARRRSPASPTTPAWSDVPAYRAALLLQDLVEPRLLRAVDAGGARAGDDRRHAHRLPPRVGRRDAGTTCPAPARFSDACAVQLPREDRARRAGAADGRARAAGGDHLLARVLAGDGRRAAATRSPRSIPNAAVDHYPFEAASLAAGLAGAAGDGEALRAGPRARATTWRARATEAGRGPRRPRDRARSGRRRRRAPTAAASRTGGGWAVVITRPLPAGCRARRPHPGGLRGVGRRAQGGGRAQDAHGVGPAARGGIAMTKVTMIPDAIAEAARWHLVGRLFERPRAGWVDDVARARAGDGRPGAAGDRRRGVSERERGRVPRRCSAPAAASRRARPVTRASAIPAGSSPTSPAATTPSGTRRAPRTRSITSRSRRASSGTSI